MRQFYRRHEAFIVSVLLTVCVCLSIYLVSLFHQLTQLKHRNDSRPVRGVVVDKGLEFWLLEFKNAALTNGIELHVNDLKLVFGSDSKFRKTEKGEEVGVCYVSNRHTPTIYIRESFWNKIGEWERRELVFHELGHCLLGRIEHNDRVENGKPVSIMNAMHQGQSVYNADTFIKMDAELFETTRIRLGLSK